MQPIRITLIFVVYMIATLSFTTPANDGKALYEHHCARCHGTDGSKGMFSAKNLRRSTLSDTAILLQIANGKRIMPSFRKRIAPDQINDIALYIKSFRKY